MNNSPIKKVLFSTICDEVITQAFLFEMAKHLSSNGQRVLYITQEPISALPATINDSEVVTDPEIMRLIQFNYAPDEIALNECLKSLVKNAKPPSVIIIHNMDQYFSDASWSQSALHSTKSSTTLIASFKNSSLPKAVKIYFGVIWHVNQKDDKIIVEIDEPTVGRPAVFHFSIHDNFKRFSLERVFLASALKVS